MVHFSVVNFFRYQGKNPGRTKFFKRQAIFRLAAKYYGRKRNCYTVAIKYVQKALLHSREGKQLKMKHTAELWKQRLIAGCEELDYDYKTLLIGMVQSDIVLNRKMLSDLAIWEPRTFKSLITIAATKAYQEDSKKGLNDLKPPPDGVITRGML